MANYYDVPIELIRVIHGMCEPEEYGEFRIADARLYNAGPDYFADYKRKWLFEVVEEETYHTYKKAYTTFRGKCHGEYKQWFDNGPPTGGVAPRLQLYIHALYVHGNLHGECKKWYNDNGGIYIHAFYACNKLHGEYKEWHYGGTARIHTFYKNNKIHGDYKQWFGNGRFKIHSFYVEGVRRHIYQVQNCDGQPRSNPLRDVV